MTEQWLNDHPTLPITYISGAIEISREDAIRRYGKVILRKGELALTVRRRVASVQMEFYGLPALTLTRPPLETAPKETREEPQTDEL